jgi:parvulin-like peptidyl-prolyl isomerase
MRLCHGIAAVLVGIAVAGCTDLTVPYRDGSTQKADRPGAPPAAIPGERQPTAAATDRVSVAHVLVGYQGAQRSEARRSKEEARKLAETVLAKARQGASFAALAQEYSEDAASKSRGGTLGSFSRDTMVKPFADAAFALAPGALSGVVETPFGFHILKRSE